MTPPPLPFDVFLSYCRDDEGMVMAVDRALTELGLRVWRDTHEIPAGESFIKTIESGLSQSRCVVLFNSQTALGSTWVQREWNVALTLNTRIIPVRLDDAELPLMLRPLESVDLRDTRKLDAVTRQIADGIRGMAVALPVAKQSSSNPSVLGKDVVVIERMIVTQQKTGKRLELARTAAVAAGLAVALGVAILARETQALWAVAAAGGSLVMAGLIAWAITAQLGLSRSEMRTLSGIKDGIELYCPNQPACEDFRIRLESILKKLAGIGGAAK